MSDRVRAPVSAELAAELPVTGLIIVVLPRIADACETSYPTVLRTEGWS
jgi:hypothetical protein